MNPAVIEYCIKPLNAILDIIECCEEIYDGLWDHVKNSHDTNYNHTTVRIS